MALALSRSRLSPVSAALSCSRTARTKNPSKRIASKGTLHYRMASTSSVSGHLHVTRSWHQVLGMVLSMRSGIVWLEGCFSGPHTRVHRRKMGWCNGRRHDQGDKWMHIESSCHEILRWSSATDPATLEELGTVPEMGLAETKEAIEAASRAFKTWSKTTAKVGKYTRQKF